MSTFPTHSSSVPSAAQPPGAGTFRPRWARVSASNRGSLQNGSLQGSASSGWVAWPADPDGAAGASPVTPCPAQGRSGTSWRTRHLAHCTAPGGPEEAFSAGGRALLRGVPVCVSRPSPPARLRPASPHRGLCPQTARPPLPVPAGSSPSPSRWPRFHGAGGGRGPATKGLSRGSLRRGGIRSRAERGAEAASAKKMSA